ncbi:MAG: hypothetical protein CW338_05425 [Clostridiales bacterium]|nr:hypothetical protein [Clostridiales bacterium]
MKDETKLHRTHKPAGLGKLLNNIPTRTPVLYPLYLARQVFRQEQEIILPGLPDAFDGFRAVFVSDIHFGAYLDERRLDEIIEKICAEDADALFLGGDYGEDTASAIRMWACVKDRFHAKEGVFAVLGNHDVSDESAVLQLTCTMIDSGISVLDNETVLIRKGDAVLAVAGLDECYHGDPDWEAVEKGCRGAQTSIILSHSPDVLPDYMKKVKEGEKAFFGLFLCGHTHGGQVAVAGKAIYSSSKYGNRYNMGMYREKGAQILVSPGIGTSFLPVRLGTKPVYHVITLKKEKETDRE